MGIFGAICIYLLTCLLTYLMALLTRPLLRKKRGRYGLYDSLILFNLCWLKGRVLQKATRLTFFMCSLIFFMSTDFIVHQHFETIRYNTKWSAKLLSWVSSNKRLYKILH